MNDKNFKDYLKEMEESRIESVNSFLEDLDDDTKELMKEAAVLGYIACHMKHADGIIPKDSEILIQAISAGLIARELYPHIFGH